MHSRKKIAATPNLHGTNLDPRPHSQHGSSCKRPAELQEAAALVGAPHALAEAGAAAPIRVVTKILFHTLMNMQMHMFRGTQPCASSHVHLRLRAPPPPPPHAHARSPCPHAHPLPMCTSSTPTHHINQMHLSPFSFTNHAP